MAWPFARRSPRTTTVRRAEETQRQQLAELRSLRALVGSLGGTMGTCETHLGQLVAMAQAVLREVTPQHLHGYEMPHQYMEPGEMTDKMRCPVPSCDWGAR